MSTIDEIQSSIQEENQELFDTLQSVFTLKSDVTKIIENKNNQFLQLKEMLKSIADYVKQEQHLRQVIAEKKVNNLEEIQRIFNAQNEAMSDLYHDYYKAKEESDQKLEGFISDLTKVLGGLTSAHNQLIDVVKRDFPNFGNQIVFVVEKHKKIINAIKNVYNNERKRTDEQTQEIDEFLKQTQKVKEKELLSNINRSVTQRLNALINKIVADNETLLAKGAFVKNDNKNYYTVKRAMEEITRNLKTSRGLGDAEQYSDSLSRLLTNTKQMVGVLSEDFNSWKDLDYESIANFNKKIDKYNGLSALNQEILNELNPNVFTHEFRSFGETIQKAQSISNEKLKQFITNGINSYKTDPLGKFDYINGNGGIIDRTKMFAKHVDYNSLHDPAHMNFTRASEGYNNVLNAIHEEHLEVAERRASYATTNKNKTAIINQEMQNLAREDFKNGRYTQPLIDYNESLLKYAKLEKKSTKETSKNLEEAIKTTYSQIYAISHFDPHSKLLDKLRSQCKMLEDTKRDVDETLKDKKTIQLKDFLKNPLKAAGLGTILTLLGAGGLFSFNKWKNMVKSQADKSGQLMYNNYMANASAGLPMGYGALDRVYNQGRTLYAISNGMVGFEAPTKMYRSLIKRVGGGMYGGGKDPRGLSAMAKYMTLPAQLYGVNENTLADFANSMYKTNKMNSQDTLDTLNRVMNDAQRANIPMEKYIKTISLMATQMRKLGYNGKHAVGIMTHMINQGMRVEDAQHMQTSILGAQTNYSMNKSNAVYAVMTGQASNMWAGMLGNLKTHDANGDPIGNRQKMIGQQMKAELDYYQFGFSDTPAMQKFLMAQKLQMMGFDRQRVSQLTETAISGSDEDLGKLLEGFEDEEIGKTEKAADGLKRMAAELKTVGAQVSHWQKMKTDMTVAANKIAESLGSHHAAMQNLSEFIHNQIEKLTPVYTGLIEKIGELPDKIKKFKDEHGEFASFLLAHPVLALAGVLGGAYLGYRGIKTLGKKAFSHWNDPKTGNPSSGKNKTKGNKKSSSKSNNKNSWWDKAKNGAKKAKGLFGKGKAGFLGGLVTALVVGNEVANASALENQNQEEENLEDKSEDELSVKFLQMFVTGESKARLRKSDGSPMEIYGETSMQTWLRNEVGISAQGLIGGGILGTVWLKKMYEWLRKKYSALPKFPKIPPLPPLPAKEKLLSGLNGVKDKLSMNELGSILKSEVKSSVPSLGIDGGKGKFGSTLKSTAKWSGAFNLISEFTDTDSPYTTGQKVARAGVDTLIDAPIYAIASKISPWLAMGLPLASWGISKITGTDPLAWVHEKAKAYFGLSSELDKYNIQYLETMFNETETDADSFLELCERKDEQGKLIKEYMKKNGVDFDSMTEVEKKIFAEEIKSLGSATTTLAQIIALAITAAKKAKQRYNQNPNYNGKKLKPWVEKTIKDWANSAFDDNDNIKWGEALVGIEWLIKKNYEIVQNPDASDEEKQKAQDLLGTLFNMRAVAKYKIGGEDHDEVVKEMATGANESYADWIASGQATKKLPANMQIVLNDGYKASIQKTVDSTNWGFAKKAMEGSEFSFEDYFDEYIADYMGQWSGDFFNNKDLVKQAYIEAKSQKILEEANPDQVEDVGANSPLPEITNPIDSEGNEGTINGMTVYRQFDPRWADNVIAGGRTMHEAGCGPTAFAMVASAHGSHYSPWQIAQVFAQKGIYVPGAGSDASKYPELAKELGFELIPTKDKNYVKQMLASGHRVIATHGAGMFTSNGHHMVYAGLNKNGKLLIANPGRNESVYTEYDVDTVLNDGDADWYVDTGQGQVIDGALEGLNGLGGGNYSYKEPTIEESHNQSISAYQKAIGFNNKNAIQGRIINGMYVDPNQSFISIEEYKKQIIAERNGEFYKPKELKKPPSEKEIKESGEDAESQSVQNSSEEKAKEAEEKRRVLQLAIQKQQQQEEQEKAKEANVAHLNVYGELKKGMSMSDFQRELEEILASMKFDPDTVVADFD